MKLLQKLSFLLLPAFVFAACDTDDEPIKTETPETAPIGAFVLNQGNQGAQLSSTYDFLDFSTDALYSNVFAQTNGIELGGSVQDAVIHGSRLYVAMFDNDLIWVVNPKTHKAIKSIKTNKPQGIVAYGDAVYVTNNDGFVSKIDTAKLEVVGTPLEVGPNPIDMEVRNGSLYVSVSDSYNWNNGYVNGKKVAKIDLANFTKTTDIAVGLNPTKLTQDANGNIFITCNGNYADVPPTIYKLTADEKAAPFALASLAEAHGDRIYLINAPYGKEVSYAVLNTTTADTITTKFGQEETPIAPISINIHKPTGDVFVTSSSTTKYPIQYTTPGYAYRYKADGTFVRRYEVGVQPYRVVFY